jgi:hypothetical protein
MDSQTTRKKPVIESKRPDYVRSAATEEVSLFCGWNYLLDLVKQVDGILASDYEKYMHWSARRGKKGRPLGVTLRKSRDSLAEEDIVMHKAAIAIFFLTGARSHEILGIYDGGKAISPPLTTAAFRLDFPDRIYVDRIAVLKKFKKIEFSWLKSQDPPVISPSREGLWHYDEDKGMFVRKVWATRRENRFRTFFFPKDEPLVPFLARWLEIHDDYMREPNVLPYDYAYWYGFFRLLDPMAEKGKYRDIVRWKHIYPHWFRAQRASQLAVEYGFSLHRLIEWFDWKSMGTAAKYAALGSPPDDRMFSAKTVWRTDKEAF